MEVISLEYIGKEAHRLKEQFFLGEMPDAQIEYGHHPEEYRRFVAVVLEAVKTYGMERLAKEARMSRQQLHSILSGTAKARRATVIKLYRALKHLL